MNIPKTLYHGTFWPEGTKLGRGGLKTDYEYVSATPDKRWARYFAMQRRVRFRDKAGILALYEIDTSKLSQRNRKRAIPPDGLDPRLDRKGEEEMREERIRVGDWRIPTIPLNAIVGKEETQRGAEPHLNYRDLIRQYHPDNLDNPDNLDLLLDDPDILDLLF